MADAGGLDTEQPRPEWRKLHDTQLRRRERGCPGDRSGQQPGTHWYRGGGGGRAQPYKSPAQDLEAQESPQGGAPPALLYCRIPSMSRSFCPALPVPFCVVSSVPLAREQPKADGEGLKSIVRTAVLPCDAIPAPRRFPAYIHVIIPLFCPTERPKETVSFTFTAALYMRSCVRACVGRGTCISATFFLTPFSTLLPFNAHHSFPFQHSSSSSAFPLCSQAWFPLLCYVRVLPASVCAKPVAGAQEASASAVAAVGDSAMDAASEGASEGRVTGSGDGDWETPRETAPSTVQRPHVVSQDPARDWEAAPGIFGGLGGAFRGPERDWGGAASSLHAAGGHLGHPAGDWDATAGFPHTLVPPQEGDSSLSASLKESVISALEKSHARFLLGQLQDLGFPEWQCRAAIALNGRSGIPSWEV